VERVSETYLVPVLESMLVQFPFVIRGFHSDNGSVVHKNLGYAHIPQACAELLNPKFETPLLPLSFGGGRC